MAVVKLEIKTRQPLADGRKFDHVGCYEQLDGTAHFAVDPAHRLNCAVTDIDLAERGRDGLVHFTADVRILAPADQGRGNHRLLFDVPNRGNRLALATFNGVPRPINPVGPTDAGNGFLMRHGYTVVWCGWQHDVPEAEGLMRIKVPEAQIDGCPVSGRLLVGFQPSKPSQVQLLSDRGHRPYPSDDLDNPNAVLMVRDGEEARPQTIPRESWSFARLEARRIVPDPNHVYLATGFEPGRIYEVIYTTTGAPVIGLGLLAARDIVSFLRLSNGADNPCAGDIQHAYAFGASQSGRFLRQLLYLGLNEDEAERTVFDGVLVHIAGGKRGGDFNMRFGQPSASLPSDPFYREEEREMLPLCAAEGIGVIPWSPQARGRLTRDWDYTSIRTETDDAHQRLFGRSVEADRKVVDRVAEVAKARGIPRAQVALAWLLAKPVITAPIVGATKLHHLDDALASVNVTLSADEITSLEAPYVPHAVVGFV